MRNFQRLLKRHQLDYGDFNSWSSRCEKQGGQGKRLLDAYEKSLKRVEVFEADLQTWMMQHVDQIDFEVRLREKGKRLAELDRLSLSILERIFAQYRRDCIAKA